MTTTLERVGRRLRGTEPGPLEVLVGSEDYEHTLLRVGVSWTGALLLGTLASILLSGSSVRSFHATAAALVIMGTFAVFVVPIGIWGRFHPTQALGIELGGITGGVLGCVVIGLTGPLHQETAAFVPGFAAIVFLFTTRRLAYVGLATTLVTYVVVVLSVHGFVDPGLRIGVVLSMTLPVALVMSWTVRKLQALGLRERAAAAEVRALAAELEDANQRLEERVAEQVEKIDSLGRLERFLSPQVAQAVLSSPDAELLRPHRRQIAVLFCDLRGFTAFAASADPEEVVDVLGGYYEAAGDLIRAYGATMGSFLGDGVMAYFNDPFPCDDPPADAVAMAQDLRHALRALSLRWQAKGFDLGFGIGVAWGYATLGTFGFEGRSDYTALGTVVNLASRLCAQATDGEILLDARAHDAVRGQVNATQVEVELKGFRAPVHAYQL